MKTYEVHTFRNGQWAFNFVFDDSDTALEEARRTERAGHHELVCVTEETIDEASDVATSRTIFRTDRRGVLKKNSAAQTAGTRRGSASPPGGEKGRGRREQTQHGRGASGIGAPILILVILAFAGAAALYGLQQLQ